MAAGKTELMRLISEQLKTASSQHTARFDDVKNYHFANNGTAEQWKKIPFTIWLHFSIFVIHFVGTIFFIGFELFSIIGLIGYEIIGAVSYYFLVYKKVVEIKRITNIEK
ncbi:MAG: hypothetical protein AN484_28320 [Aphanizomenon flos-aquae WA102]|uniref:Uncharacterized protein n=1 Tax=Aphanizomenon flos-aquae WA102 TaxID=1710896 RepID=A0A1B7W4N2_APHFL|nr:MAG: hypothetical protein AN484_28320 [Aphanizomenon flos-aquae WA102]